MQHNEVVVENKEKRVTLRKELEKSPYFVSLDEDLGKSKKMKSHDTDKIFITTGANNESVSRLDKKR